MGRAGNTQRPKSVAQWSVVDVQKLLRRHCGDFYHLYCEAFLEQVLKMMHSDHILDYHVFTLTDI